MCEQEQKNEEEFYVQKFFEVMGWGAERIKRHERPDLIVTLRGHRIGVEVTMFHSAATDADGRPRRAMEQDCERIMQQLMKEVRRQTPLRGIHGYLKFQDFRVPSHEERSNFVAELVKVALSERPPPGEEKRVFLEEHATNCPTATRYIETLKLVNKGFHATWGHNLGVAFAGPSERDLPDLVQKKVGEAKSYKTEALDELWLLIVSGELLSQAARTISAEELNAWEEVTIPLNQSLYDKAFLFQYMRDRVLQFDRSSG
jgi:hypothetical protein